MAISSADTGSSQTIRSGPLASARATFSRCRWPPENWCGYSACWSCRRPTSSNISRPAPTPARRRRSGPALAEPPRATFIAAAGRRRTGADTAPAGPPQAHQFAIHARRGRRADVHQVQRRARCRRRWRGLSEEYGSWNTSCNWRRMRRNGSRAGRSGPVRRNGWRRRWLGQTQHRQRRGGLARARLAHDASAGPAPARRTRRPPPWTWRSPPPAMGKCTEVAHRQQRAAGRSMD